MVDLRHQLREEFPESNFEILAFPCNQFGGQEPQPAKEIKEFVKKFNVDFPMFDKIEVNGPNTHEIFQFLKYNTSDLCSAKDPPVLGAIGWNFGKFLVDGEGHVVKYYGPKVNPADTKDDCIKVIKGELSGKSKDPPSEAIVEEKKEDCGG